MAPPCRQESRMRLALICVFSLALTGCALWRSDREEPVEPRSTQEEKTGPVLKPSEVLKPKSAEAFEIASPITDRFYMRGMYFQPTVNTTLQLDPSQTVDGTELDAEEDLGLDDTLNQGRMEFDIRMKRRNHVRIDYFKMSRFHEQPLPRDIQFGDFTFQEGTVFRSKLDWRVLSITYTYSFFRFDRFEAGVGLGLHLIEAQAEGREPGTTRVEKNSKVAPFPTVAINSAFRLSKRFSVTARAQQFSASPEDIKGSMSDYHIDLQYRWHKNAAIGLGYTMLETDVEVTDTDDPLTFNMSTKGPELFFRVSF
jgi:hypothetical protein